MKLPTILAAICLSCLVYCNQSFARIGDLNGDSACDLLDVIELGSLINTGGFAPEGDLNIDGVIDGQDLTLMGDLLMFGTGDISRDGSIDFLDILPFRIIFSSGGYDVLADMNGDASVDSFDVLLFLSALTSGQSTHP